MSINPVQPKITSTSFQGLGLNPKLLEILTGVGFTVPTPIQSLAIPAAVTGKDMIGIAQTGTGKTLAFGLPMIQRIAQSKGKGLVILPTRELALQVDETFKKIGRSLGLKTAVLIGGQSMGVQLSALRRNPNVIIATPGRLIDHLEQGTTKLDQVSVLVLDEADRMLDMGFAPQMKVILEKVPKTRQTMLFSATMSSTIIKIAEASMNLPLRVEVAPAGTPAGRVIQEVFFVHKNDKLSLLEKLLRDYKGTVLVFSRTKFGAKKISASLNTSGFSSTEIHSNRTLPQRRAALDGFKSGRYRVLVATDIAARGIDVTGIELVVNFDLPDSNEDYVHRIGRTGRAGLPGRAISFATPEQKGDVRAIERLIKKTLAVLQVPSDLPKRKFETPKSEDFSPKQSFSRPFKPRSDRNQKTFGKDRRSRFQARSRGFAR